jgi:hypothetical protein
VFRAWALYSRCVALVLVVEVGVTNGYFVVHAPRPLLEALIRMAGRLTPSRGVMEAA